MFEPVRGGTRGGQAEFKWSDVSADKDRENYLGHSINAPTGRWQKNKDVHWYARDKGGDEASMREEIRRVKEQEAEALAAALGFGPSGKPGSSATPGGGPTTGANAIAVPDAAGPSADHDAKKEEKRKRKEEKRLRKEKRRAEKEEGKRHRHRSDSRSRSRSPRRHKDERSKSKHRSRSPPPRRERDERPYDESQREKEREWARRRWEDNARREQPAGARWGRD